jgi:hypothetical protein
MIEFDHEGQSPLARKELITHAVGTFTYFRYSLIKKKYAYLLKSYLRQPV